MPTIPNSVRLIACALAVGLLSSACSARSTEGAVPSLIREGDAAALGTRTPIKHIVIIVQESRTLNNMFAGWPNALAPTIGIDQFRGPIRLQVMKYAQDRSMCELWPCMIVAEGPLMNDFELNKFSKLGGDHFPNPEGPDVGLVPYTYMDHAEIAPYRALASQYVLADRMFPTEEGGDFTAHQTLISGSTFVDKTRFISDVPNHEPWGCDAPRGTTVPLNRAGSVPDGTTSPCITAYPTMADTMDAAGISWKYYVASESSGDPSGRLWNAFDAIKKVRYGADWQKNIVSPPSRILADASRGELPDVSWVIPEVAWSDHPSTPSDMGPSWVGSVVNAIGTGPDWQSTAIVVVWSEWGGFYDFLMPYRPIDNAGMGVGFRVPCLIVSPYAKKGYVSHKFYQFGSILQLVEQTLALPPLSSTGYGYQFTDVGLGTFSMLDSFDFSQKPRAFRRIPTKYPASAFAGH